MFKHHIHLVLNPKLCQALFTMHIDNKSPKHIIHIHTYRQQTYNTLTYKLEHKHQGCFTYI